MQYHRISLLSLFLMLLISDAAFSQDLNWKRVTPETKHLLYANIGYDFSTSAALGYGYHLPLSLPVVLNAEFSRPFGERALDDFKTKIGGQAELLHLGNFSASVKVYSVFRRFESNLVRLENFGSETGAVLGYYKRKWHIAAEIDFDKAITTHLVHQPVMKENNPGLQDGWYIPTGGNFFYGLQTGWSFGKNDLQLSLGKTINQDFKTNSSIPFYFQLGYNRWF